MSNIYKKTSKLLIKNKSSISFAESCTGGLLAYSLIKNKNVSQIINQSYIVYSNKIKRKILKVKKKTLKKQGAVSLKCVKEMSKGLYKISKSDFCISVSGIAGPNGGSSSKQVGRVYACILHKGKNFFYEFNLKGNRQKIQKSATKKIFKKIYSLGNLY